MKIEVVRSYVDAQQEYFSRDRDGRAVPECAQRLSSRPVTRDGLYWPSTSDEDVSPIGPLVALAQGEGCELGCPSGAKPPAPFHGCLFQIVERQGPHAPGGKYDHVVSGDLIGGFALLAWPAEYGQSGIMTFIASRQGAVYQQDPGLGSAKAARKITVDEPDKSWRTSPE